MARVKKRRIVKPSKPPAYSPNQHAPKRTSTTGNGLYAYSDLEWAFIKFMDRHKRRMGRMPDNRELFALSIAFGMRRMNSVVE